MASDRIAISKSALSLLGAVKQGHQEILFEGPARTGKSFTLCLFVLFSKGWSPQFVAYLVPLVLFAMPGRLGLGLVLALSAVTFLEMPGWVIYGDGRPALGVAVILLRTVILVVATGALWKQCRAGGPAAAILET